jgi:CelD/BcsL family acetyltransferase involved in cellulose biosynthesis
MSRCDVIAVSNLDPSLRADWNELRATNPAYASPYFSPEFYEAVAGVTGSARLLIVEEDGRTAAVLPFQRRRLGLAGPIGGPLNDLHGLIADRHSPRAPATLPVFPLQHAPLGVPAMGARFGETHDFHVMHIADGYAAYELRRQPFAKSAFRALRTRSEKARKQFGPLTHVFDDRSPVAFEQLITWKREQFAATHQISLFDIRWVRELTDRLFATRATALRGQLSTLYFGDRLVAAHFGLRTAKVLHYWFPGYDPMVAELSPGNILLGLMAQCAAAEGCEAVHLGSGSYRYKLEFADRQIAVTSGLAFSTSLAGRAAAGTGRAFTALARALPTSCADLPGKVFRRIDRHLGFSAA